MLRILVLALALINGVYFAWSQGLLQAYGFAPAQQTEPQRLAEQIKPEALRRLTSQELRLAEAPVAGQPGVCLQAGLFDEPQSELLRAALASALPVDAWQLDAAVEPARWIVYLGKFASAQMLVQKRSELAGLNVRVEPLSNPALQFGLSLGSFETQAAADAELVALRERGVRTARVLQERAELRGMLLRLPAADDSLRARLDELKPVLAGKLWRPCQ